MLYSIGIWCPLSLLDWLPCIIKRNKKGLRQSENSYGMQVYIAHILIEQKEEQMFNLDDSLALNDAIEQIPYCRVIWPHNFPTEYKLSC
jgi:hypothetical protein